MAGTDPLTEKHQKSKSATEWLAHVNRKESKTNNLLLYGSYLYIRKLKNTLNQKLVLVVGCTRCQCPDLWILDLAFWENNKYNISTHMGL